MGNYGLHKTQKQISNFEVSLLFHFIILAFFVLQIQSTLAHFLLLHHRHYHLFTNWPHFSIIDQVQRISLGKYIFYPHGGLLKGKNPTEHSLFFIIIIIVIIIVVILIIILVTSIVVFFVIIIVIIIFLNIVIIILSPWPPWPLAELPTSQTWQRPSPEC